MRDRDPALMRERRPDLVIRDAARVLTCDAAWTEFVDADIVIDGGRITAVGPGAAAGIAPHESDIDGSGRAAIPGMVNSHFHSPGNFMKGAVPSLPLELFMLYEIPPFMTSPVSEHYAYLRTLLGAVDMLKQGVTAVHDDADCARGAERAWTLYDHSYRAGLSHPVSMNRRLNQPE